MRPRARKRHVLELRVTRENGDPDVIYLCSDCRASVDDFLKVTKSRRYPVHCDRCGWSEAQEELDELLRASRLPTPFQR